MSDEGTSKDGVSTEGGSQAGSFKQLEGPEKAAIELTPAQLESLSAMVAQNISKHLGQAQPSPLQTSMPADGGE